MALKVTLNPSRNSKLTGGQKLNFYATYRAVGFSCPTTCQLLREGACYAMGGNVAMHQRGAYSNADGRVFLESLNRIPENAFMRIHVSGDIMMDGNEKGSDVVDFDYLNSMIEGARNRPDITFYGYTHAWKYLDVKPDFPSNLVINASCDTMEDVEIAKAAGWDTTTVVPHDVEYKRQGSVVVCPQQTSDMSCAECKLCMKPNRKLTVAFKAHGFNKRKASKRIELEMVA